MKIHLVLRHNIKFIALLSLLLSHGIGLAQDCTTTIKLENGVTYTDDLPVHPSGLATDARNTVNYSNRADTIHRITASCKGMATIKIEVAAPVFRICY